MSAPAHPSNGDISGGDLPDITASDRIDADGPARRVPLREEWDVVVAVAVGGVLGAEARYGIDRLVRTAATGFPWATWTINVVGCLGMGVLMGVLTQLAAPHRLVRPLLGIGVLGGFTTYSGFTVDVVRLVDGHHAGLAAAYLLATIAAAAAALAVATVATRAVARRRRSPVRTRRARA